MGLWRQAVIDSADKSGFPIHTPYFELPQKHKDDLWHGTRYFKGIDDYFAMLEKDSYKMHYRIMLARYRGKTVCPECHGKRPEKGSLLREGGRVQHNGYGGYAAG